MEYQMEYNCLNHIFSFIEPVEQIDAYSVHPGRKIWAEKKCEVLKSDIFVPCHSEVAVDKFMKRCIFDAVHKKLL